MKRSLLTYFSLASTLFVFPIVPVQATPCTDGTIVISTPGAVVQADATHNYQFNIASGSPATLQVINMALCGDTNTFSIENIGNVTGNLVQYEGGLHNYTYGAISLLGNDAIQFVPDSMNNQINDFYAPITLDAQEGTITFLPAINGVGVTFSQDVTSITAASIIGTDAHTTMSIISNNSSQTIIDAAISNVDSLNTSGVESVLFSKDVTVNSVSINNTTIFQEPLTCDFLSLSSNGIAQILSPSNNNIGTINVNMSTQATGQLLFADNGNASGNIGGAPAPNPPHRKRTLELLEFNTGGNGNTTLTLGGENIYANIVVGAGGANTIAFTNTNPPTTIGGTLTTNNSNSDTILFAGAVTLLNAAQTTLVAADIGSSSQPFLAVEFAPNTQNISQNIYASTIQLGGQGTQLTVNSGATLFGTVISTGQNTDSVIFQGAVNLNGDIGTNNNPLLEVSFAANTQSTSQNIYASTVQLGGGGAQLTVNDGEFLSANVTSLGNGTDTIVLEGNSTINNNWGSVNLPLAAININGIPGKTVTLNNSAVLDTNNVNVTSGGTFAIAPATTPVINGSFTVSNGTLSVGSNASLSVAGNAFTLGNSTTFVVDLTPMGPSVNITNGGAVNIGSSNNPVILIPQNLAVPLGTTTVLLIENVNNPSTIHFIVENTNNGLVSFNTPIVQQNNVYLTVTIEPATSIPLIGQARNLNPIATTLGLLLGPNAPAGLLGAVVNAQLTMSEQELILGFENFAPNVSNAIIMSSMGQVPSLIFAPIQNHIYAMAGIASGDITIEHGGSWARLLGQRANQATETTFEGYKDTTWGLMIGQDIELAENILAGLAFSFASTNIDMQLSGSTTLAKNFQLTLYGGWTALPYYLNLLGLVAYNQYDTARNVVFGPVSFYPQSNYHGWQLGAQGEIGYDYAQCDYHLIPFASFYYGNLSLSAYTETNAGTAGASYQSADYNLFLPSIGLRLLRDYQDCENIYRPQIHAQLFYNVTDDPVQTTSQFIGGGPAFTTIGLTPPHWSYDVGASITTMRKTSGWMLELRYDYNWQSGYHASSGFLNVRYEY